MHDVAPTSAAEIDPPDVGLSVRLDRVRTSALTRNAVIVGAVAFLLGLVRLGTPSVWVDESFTARAMQSSFWGYIDGYHWLYYSITKPWTLVAGTSEWALRMPSVFGAMFACVLMVVLAHKLFGQWVALVSGLLLATSPFFVKWSQQARGYTLLVAVSLLATVLLIRALERGSRGAWALYGLAFSVVLVWHPVAGLLLVPAQAVLIYQRRERVLPHGVLAAILICAFGGTWAAQIAMRSTGEGVAMDWLDAPSGEVALRALLDVSGAAGLGLLLAVVGVGLLRRAGRADLALWLGTWAVAPFLVSLLITVFRPVYLDRYLIVAAPAFALLAGVAIVGIGSRMRAAAGLAVVVATSVGLVLWYSEGGRGNWRGEDWRSAVATVDDRRAESNAVVVAPWSANPAATYYGARASDVSTADSIWVLTWSETGDELLEADRRGLGFGDHRLVERLEFGWRVTAQLWKREP